MSTVTDTARAVFLSYASQDAKAAGRICDALRAAGIVVWFDQSELRGGDAWDVSIRRQIKNCALFIPVISRNTHARDEGYFRLEWKLAVDRSHLMVADRPFLVPVVVDDTSDQDEKVPDRFREVQWTRLPSGVTPAAFVEHVRRLLSGALAHEPSRTGSAAAISAAASTRKSDPAAWGTKAALLATSTVIFLVLGYLMANRLLFSKHVAEGAAPPQSTALSAPAAAFSPPPHSIAVLPFVNMSGDAKQEYFSDGISEELLNSLSRLNDLEVVARTSSFSFKGQNIDVATIAHKLNVGAVLEGSVRRAGNTVRITVQLINAVSGFHMWSQTYDRNLKDILKVQTDVATSVAQQLQVKLIGDEAAKIEQGGTHVPQAYDAFLRGVHMLHVAGSAAEYREAAKVFDQAIELDPNYGLAHAWKAAALWDYAAWHSQDPLAVRKAMTMQARQAAEQAIKLAPDFAGVHSLLGIIKVAAFRDHAGAAAEMKRALVSAPDDAEILNNYAIYEAMLNQPQEAMRAMRRAIQLDPQNYMFRINLAVTLFRDRKFSDARDALNDAKALNPISHEIAAGRIDSELALGQATSAASECESESTPMDDDDRYECLALAYHALGREKEAVAQFEKLKALNGDSGALDYARVYAQWGETASALRWFAAAERQQEPGIMWERSDWMLDPIRNYPEFKATERRLNFP